MRPSPLPAAGARPVVVGHRGAPVSRPEHTRASYALAVAQGADGVDVDVVASADGVLVVRHDDEVSATTDAADRPDLAALRTTRTVDGVHLTGWFTEDLTAAQVRSLRARERLPALRPASAAHDGEQGVLTLAEVLALRAELSARAGRPVAVWPELKHPSHSAALGLPLEEPLLAALDVAGLLERGAPVVVQSFETACLRALRRAVPHLRTAQLVAPTGAPPDLAAAGDLRTYDDLLEPAGLAELAGWADVLAPHTVQVHPRDARGTARGCSPLVGAAHRAGMAVVPYTVRPENTFLPAELRRGPDPAARGDVGEELRRLWAAGVDGVFTDAPGLAVASRRSAVCEGGGPETDPTGGSAWPSAPSACSETRCCAGAPPRSSTSTASCGTWSPT